MKAIEVFYDNNYNICGMIVTKYHPPGNVRGARISASAEGGHRIFISYPHEYDTTAAHAQAALALCRKLNWSQDLICAGLPNGGNVFVFADSPDLCIFKTHD